MSKISSRHSLLIAIYLTSTLVSTYRLDRTSRSRKVYRSLHSLPGFSADPVDCYVPPLPVSLSREQFSDILKELDEQISNVWKHRPLSVKGGLSVNLIYDQEVVWSKGFGQRNNSAPHLGPPDGGTAFRIGSITKVFTTLLALMHRDTGHWDLDDELSKHIPNFSVVNPFKTSRGITLRQLGSHMAGLPDESPCDNLFLGGCNVSSEVIIENLHKTILERPPGVKPDYSNLGFALLGEAEKVITNTPWSDQVTQLARDLKMTNTHADIPTRPNANIAEGYNQDGSVAPWVDIGFEAPAGQMFSSTDDLAKLIMMIFRQNMSADVEKGQVLDGQTLREWMLPVYVAQDRTGYGFVWELMQGGHYTFLTKGGSIFGYQSEMFLLHDLKIGGVVFVNSDDQDMVDATLRVLLETVPKIDKLLRENQPAPILPPSPEDYVGNYSTKHDVYPGMKISISIELRTLSDGHRHLVLGGMLDDYPGTLEFREKDIFQVSTRFISHPCDAEMANQDVYLEFQRDTNGKVISATAPGFDFGMIMYKSEAADLQAVAQLYRKTEV